MPLVWKEKSSVILYLTKLAKKVLSIIQWVASFSPICYHKVILQDASTVFPEPFLWCLWKPSLFINILNTFTLIQNFMKIQLQVIFQYCQNVHVCIETACYSWPAYKNRIFWCVNYDILASLFSSSSTVLWSFPVVSFCKPWMNFSQFWGLPSFNNYPPLKKCLLLIKADSFLGSG